MLSSWFKGPNEVKIVAVTLLIIIIILNLLIVSCSLDSRLKTMAEEYNIQELREKIAETIGQFEFAQQFILPQSQGNVADYEDWLESITKEGTWCDDMFIFLAASMLKKKIILLPVYPDDGHGQSGQIIVDPDETIGNPLHLLYYKDVHFQSIVPIDSDANSTSN